MCYNTITRPYVRHPLQAVEIDTAEAITYDGENQMLTQKRLKELFNYNPETGILTRKVSAGQDNKGHTAGTLRRDGYYVVRVDYKLYLVHRLIWIFVNGDIDTEKKIDHLDGVRSNNSILNLRLVDDAANRKNSAMKSDNTSGYTGVSYEKNYNRWFAYINVNKKRINHGRYDDMNDAIRARKKAEIKYGFSKRHGKRILNG